MMTREDMEKVIARGESVKFGFGQNARIIKDLKDLPSIAEFCEANPELAAKYLPALEATLKDVQNQIARVRKVVKGEG